MNDYGPMLEVLESYFRLMNANASARVYLEALHAGILDALHAGRKSAAEVASHCGLVEAPTVLVLDALCTLGVAQRDGERFGLSLLGLMLLQGSYRELGNQYWAHLPALLKTGRPLIRLDHPEQSEAHYQSQAAVLGWMLAPSAEAAADLLDIGRSFKNVSILDVGAGSAIWSLTMARRDPGATVTAIDWPTVLEVARQTADSMQLANRLTTLAGNYHDIELPNVSFDLAILANITHLETPQRNRSLFKRVRAALKPAGRILIVDVLPGQPQGDLNRALYAIGLALRTQQGAVHRPEDLETWLVESGFQAVRCAPLETPPNALGMITANVV